MAAHDIVDVPQPPGITNLGGEDNLAFSGGQSFRWPLGLPWSSKNFTIAMVVRVGASGGGARWITGFGGVTDFGISSASDAAPSGMLGQRVSTFIGANQSPQSTRPFFGDNWALLTVDCGPSGATISLDAEDQNHANTGTRSGTVDHATTDYFGQWYSTPAYMSGALRSIFIFDGQASATDLDALRDYCRARWQVGRSSKSSAWATDGDSITAGTVALPWSHWAGDSADFATQDGRYKFRGFAVNGHTSAQVLAGLQDPKDWLADAITFGYSNVGYAAMVGTNDINNGDTAATIQGNISTIVTEMHALGHRVALFTVLPSDRFTGSKETERNSLNAWLLANSVGADIVVDLTGIPELQDPTDLNYYTDGIHPNVAGNKLIGAASWAAGIN